jgi:hypothetical protein
MIAKADVRRVQEWMGHAEIQTTMKYLRYAPHADDARLVGAAFATDDLGESARDQLGRLGTSWGRKHAVRTVWSSPGAGFR